MVQTFLPYDSFAKSLSCLDLKRLGNQRRECRSILTVLLDKPDSRYRNHAAVRMWRGYENALILYYNCALEIFAERGGHNIQLKPLEYLDKPMLFPPWLGDDRVHASHRSKLLSKKPEWYQKYNWTESPDMPYFWPVPKE